MTYNPWRGMTDLPAPVWVLFTANLVNRMGTMARAFMVLYLTTRMGVAPARAGVALTVFGVAAIISGPVAGRLCDRIGALPVMWGTLASGALLVACIPWIHRFTGVLVCVAVWAFMSEGYRPASLVLLSEATAPESRRLAMSVNRLAINLGTSIGPAVGGLLAGVSFTALFLVDACTSMIGAVLLFTWWYRHGRITLTPVHTPHPNVLRSVLRDERLWRLVIGTLLVTAVFMQLEGAWSVHLIKTLHFPPSFYGMMLTINGLLIVTCEIPIVNATQRLSHRVVVIAACLLIGGGIGAMAFVHSAAAVIVSVVVWTVGEMLLFTILPTLYEEYAPPGARGAYMGAYAVAISGAFAVGAWLGIAVLANAGPVVMWSGCFLTAAIAAIVLTYRSEAI